MEKFEIRDSIGNVCTTDFNDAEELDIFVEGCKRPANTFADILSTLTKHKGDSVKYTTLYSKILELLDKYITYGELIDAIVWHEGQQNWVQR